MNWKDKTLEIISRTGKLPKVKFGKEVEVREQEEYKPKVDNTKYPSKEELKKVHLEIIDKLHNELSEVELYWLCFVVDDDTRSGLWIDRTNNYLKLDKNV
mgnify:FL=1